MLVVTSGLSAWEEDMVKGPGRLGQCPLLLQPRWTRLHSSRELPLRLLLTCPAFRGVTMYLHRILAFFFFLSSCFHSDSVSNTEGTGHAAFPLEDVTCHMHPPICVPFMKAVPHRGPDVGFRACQTWLCFLAGVSLARLLSAL